MGVFHCFFLLETGFQVELLFKVSKWFKQPFWENIGGFAVETGRDDAKP
jgi:hypothetical protein